MVCYLEKSQAATEASIARNAENAAYIAVQNTRLKKIIPSSPLGFASTRASRLKIHQNTKNAGTEINQAIQISRNTQAARRLGFDGAECSGLGGGGVIGFAVCIYNFSTASMC